MLSNPIYNKECSVILSKLHNKKADTRDNKYNTTKSPYIQRYELCLQDEYVYEVKGIIFQKYANNLLKQNILLLKFLHKFVF